MQVSFFDLCLDESLEHQQYTNWVKQSNLPQSSYEGGKNPQRPKPFWCKHAFWPCKVGHVNMGIYEDRLACGASIEWALAVFLHISLLSLFFSSCHLVSTSKIPSPRGQEVQHKEWYLYNLTWCMSRDAGSDISFLTVAMIRNSSNYPGGVMLDSCVKGWKPFLVRSCHGDLSCLLRCFNWN